jgi:hypothetical protein
MNNRILDVFRQPVKHGWKRWQKNDSLLAFIDTPATECYLHSQYADGHSDMQRVMSTKEVKLSMNRVLIQVNTGCTIVGCCLCVVPWEAAAYGSQLPGE